MIYLIFIAITIFIIYLVSSSSKEKPIIEDKPINSIKEFRERYDGDEPISEELAKTYKELEYLENIKIMDRSTIKDDDYNSLYYHYKSMTKQAMKAKEYNNAWQYLADCELNLEMYYQEGNSHWTFRNYIAITSWVWEKRANIHRVEKRHHDALHSYMTALITSQRPTQTMINRLPAYFNRAKLKDITIEEVWDFINKTDYKNAFMEARNKVSEWMEKE